MKQPLRRSCAPPEGKTIIRETRRDKAHPFVRIANAVARDSRLTFEARGMVIYLLSHDDNWEIWDEDLQREGDIGRDKVTRIRKELERYGYLTPKLRIKNPDGTFYWTRAILHETPCTENPSMVGGSRGKPLSGKPEDGHPVHGKSGIYKPQTQPTTKAATKDQRNEEGTTHPTGNEPRGEQGNVGVSSSSSDFIDNSNPWDLNPFTYEDVTQHVQYRIDQGDEIHTPIGLVKSILKNRDPNDYMEIEASLIDIESERYALAAKREQEKAERLRVRQYLEQKAQEENERRVREEQLKAEREERQRQTEIAESPERERQRLAKTVAQQKAEEDADKLRKKLQERIERKKANAAA
jgi:hypothetical protein